MFHIFTKFFACSRARKGLISLMEAWEAFPPSGYLHSDGLISQMGLFSSVFSSSARNGDIGIYGHNTPQFVLDHMGWNRILREIIKKEKRTVLSVLEASFLISVLQRKNDQTTPRKLWINIKGHRTELSDHLTQRFTSFVFSKESVTDPSILITFVTQLS